MRRWQWVLPVALGLVLLAGIGYWGYQQFILRKQLEIALNNKYYRSFYDMIENMQNVEVLLSKLLVAQAPEQDSQILMELWQRSNATQANLNQLPVPDILMGQTAKFLSQVGDYAYSLLDKTSTGKPKTVKEWETLRRLYKQASALNAQFHDLENHLSSGKLYMSELARQTSIFVRREGPKLANNEFQVIEKHMKGLPALIYDGPFSDHVEKKKPQGLTGGQVNADLSKNKALKFIDPRPDVDYVVENVNINKGKIQAYQVDIASRPLSKNEKITMALSREGAHVIWLTNSRDIGERRISLTEGQKKAMDFLNKRGYHNMVPIYYQKGDDVAIFNFAATQNGVILYPDQIKVTVALDNGQVVGFEAFSYLMAHHRRNLPKPQLTESEARAKLSPHLKQLSSGRLVLIPTSTDKEKLAYEFRGQLDNETFLIYINAVDGTEEQVLRLVKSSEGMLTL